MYYYITQIKNYKITTVSITPTKLIISIIKSKCITNIKFSNNINNIIIIIVINIKINFITVITIIISTTNIITIITFITITIITTLAPNISHIILRPN
jgi:hypothetical protein